MRLRFFVAGGCGLVLAVAAPAVQAQHLTFKHIVIVIQENRTPDNIFGSNPTFEKHVDIASSGVNSKGKTITLTPVSLASCYDLDHTHGAFEKSYHYGADQDTVIHDDPTCVVPPDPQFKYTDNSSGQMQPYFDIATNYGFANRMFQTNEGPSFPAHQFLFGGTSQPTADSPLFVSENPSVNNEPNGCEAPPNQRVTLIDGNGSTKTNPPIFPCFEHPTLSDLLDQAAISWHYYAPSPGSYWTAPNAIAHICGVAVINGVSVCNGPDWLNGDVQANNPSQVLTDVQNCALASVSWVIPTTNNSDHATVNDGGGPDWVAGIVNTIGEQPTCSSGENYWSDTAIIITWDDWGGWFDHVSPFAVNLDSASTVQWGDGYTYGFRVPLMIVSPYTPAGLVDDKIHDFGSILRLVERNFGLGFIGPGDSIYGTYADFQAANRGDFLGAFFPLTKPRAFTPIATTVPANYFKTERVIPGPVDDDR